MCSSSSPRTATIHTVFLPLLPRTALRGCLHELHRHVTACYNAVHCLPAQQVHSVTASPHSAFHVHIWCVVLIQKHCRYSQLATVKAENIRSYVPAWQVAQV